VTCENVGFDLVDVSKRGFLVLFGQPWNHHDLGRAKGQEEASLRYIDKVEADVLAGHFDIVGFEMMRGSICDHGLDRRVFDKFETVWSGHFHHPSKHANIEYLGAPYEMTWTDHNGTRGFHIFDTETRTLTRVHNPYRMFNKITYHDADLTIEEINDLDPSPLKGTYVKIVVAAKTNPYLFELFVNKIQAADPVDVKIVEDNFNLENLSEEEIIDEAMGTREAFFDYIDNVLPDSVGDKEAIKKLMDELLEKFRENAGKILDNDRILLSKVEANN
jgi:hypothetical protein